MDQKTHNAPTTRQGVLLRPGSLLRLCFRVEAEGGGVYAVALARRGGSVVEDVSLVRPAGRAVDFDAAHEETAVLLGLDVSLVERRPVGSRATGRQRTRTRRVPSAA